MDSGINIVNMNSSTGKLKVSTLLQYLNNAHKTLQEL